MTPPPRARAWARAALFAYVLVLAVAVLSPAPEPLAADPPLDEVIGWLADAIRNVVLFLPIGAGLIAWRRSLPVSVGLGFSLSLAIELLQQLVPGRHPSLVDLGTNTLGTALGAGLYVSRHHWLAPTPTWAKRLALAAWLAAACLLAASALLLRPAPSDAQHFGGWTPELGHFERYEGHVVEAHLGPVPIPSGGRVADGARLREALRSAAPIVIRAVAGPPPPALAPLVTLHDALQREILLVGVDGADLLLRSRTLGASLGLEPPDLRCQGAFAELAAGQPFTLRLERAGDRVRVEVAGRSRGTLRWTPGRSWSLLVPGASRSAPLAVALDIAWLALLALPASCFARRGGRLLAVAAGFAALLLALPLLGPIAQPPAHEWLGLASGLLLGRLAWSVEPPVASPEPLPAARPGSP